MKNIHVLPTEKPSRLQLQMNGKYHLENGQTISLKKYQNIYITSDEEIKGGDYFYQDFDSIIHKCYKLTDNYVIADKPSDYPKKICKKIILTTDQDLIKDGVQDIDDEFLEWFVKNPSCELVETKLVEFEVDMGLGDSCIEYSSYYKIIIPKEEPKQETPEEVKDLAYYKTNAEEDYLQVPISVLRYISQLEQEQDKNKYSEEEVKLLIYNVCGEVARLQGITLNGNHIDTAYKKLKNK
jgi:hypothetical protein